MRKTKSRTTKKKSQDAPKENRGRDSSVKEPKQITPLRLFDVFLKSQASHNFKVYIPYDSPFESFLRQISGEVWVFKRGVADAYEMPTFVVPEWAQVFEEKLAEKQLDTPYTLSGKQAREILRESVAEVKNGNRKGA